MFAAICLQRQWGNLLAYERYLKSNAQALWSRNDLCILKEAAALFRTATGRDSIAVLRYADTLTK
jgi:hypothetical protein